MVEGGLVPDDCPDLTPAQVAWLKERYPLPIWDGKPETSAQYLREVGHWEVALELSRMLAEGDDPLVYGERAS